MVHLKDPHRRTVRDSAIEAITALGPLATEAIPALVECLGAQGFNSAEEQIAKALDSMGDHAVEPLARNLKKPDAAARYVTARTLGELGPKAAAAIPALEQALSDPHYRVMSEAASALKKIKTPQNK